MNDIEKNSNQDMEFYRHLLMENYKNMAIISKGWMKTLKIITTVLSIVIICGFIVCGVIVNRYLSYAYAPDAIEQSNTNTNINTNTNENK